MTGPGTVGVIQLRNSFRACKSRYSMGLRDVGVDTPLKTARRCGSGYRYIFERGLGVVRYSSVTGPGYVGMDTAL
jgi:hypothetical protein